MVKHLQLFTIASSVKYDKGYQMLLLQCFMNESSGGTAIKSEVISCQCLADQLYKIIFGTLKKLEVMFSFLGSIWGC